MAQASLHRKTWWEKYFGCCCPTRQHQRRQAAYAPSPRRVVHVLPATAIGASTISPVPPRPDQHPSRRIITPPTAIRRLPAPPARIFVNIQDAKRTLGGGSSTNWDIHTALRYIWMNSDHPVKELLSTWKESGPAGNKVKIAEFIVYNISNDETLDLEPAIKIAILRYLWAIGDIQDPATVSYETAKEARKLEVMIDASAFDGSSTFRFPTCEPNIRALRDELDIPIRKFCSSS